VAIVPPLRAVRAELCAFVPMRIVRVAPAARVRRVDLAVRVRAVPPARVLEVSAAIARADLAALQAVVPAARVRLPRSIPMS
jgi:hypothetical protein